MLELINNERRRSGSAEVVLGNNNAAQLHAEASLNGCYSSHWGDDGLKPYMRYSLGGGYQSNGENGSGSDYCVTARDGYSALSATRTEIRGTMAGWMSSPGHRRNILENGHRKVNIGLAWDRYNFKAVQHFEGDHVEYETLPSLEGGRLVLDGKAMGGSRFGVADFVSIEIAYDPPPHSLTRGQLSKTYCYSFGEPVAYVRKPLTGRRYYPNDTISTSHQRCPDPYDVSPESAAPQSHAQAHASWQSAYAASRSLPETPVSMQAVTASTWQVDGINFKVIADLSRILNEHGPGVYTVILWGTVGGEADIISEYSIFHEIPRPDGYD